MKERLLKIIEPVLYWSIIALPFFMAIAPAPMNVFMGFIIVFFTLKKLLRKERFFENTGLNAALACWFIVTCLSFVQALNKADCLRGGIFRLFLYVFIFFALASEVKDKKHIQRIVASICFGISLISIDALWQVFTGKDFIRGYEPIINIGLVRAKASFKDANILGIYLSAFSPILFGLSLYYFKGWRRVAACVLSFLVLIGILLTYARPTFLAVFIVLVFFAFVKKDKRILIPLSIVLMLSPFIVPKSVKQWAKDVEYNPMRMMCNDDRIAVYHNAFRMIKAHPLLGVGANQFMSSYKYYKENPEYRNVVTLAEMKAHNTFIHMAGEIGLIGFAVFLWLLFTIFKIALEVYRKLKDEYLKVIALSLTACLIAFLVNGLTESSLQYSHVGPIFLYLCGFLVCLRKQTAV